MFGFATFAVLKKTLQATSYFLRLASFIHLLILTVICLLNFICIYIHYTQYMYETLVLPFALFYHTCLMVCS